MSLTTLFTDIADAIREKEGTTAEITASAFPDRIRSIPSGGGTAKLLRTLTITEPIEPTESIQLDWDSDWNNFNFFLIVPDVKLSKTSWLYVGPFRDYFGPQSAGYTHCTPEMVGGLTIIDEKIGLLNFGRSSTARPVNGFSGLTFYTYEKEDASILSGSIALYGIKI